MFPKINTSWTATMDDTQLKAIPIAKRTRIADKIVVDMANFVKKIISNCANMAYNQQKSNIVAENITASNIAKAPTLTIIKETKKRGRKPKSEKTK